MWETRLFFRKKNYEIWETVTSFVFNNFFEMCVTYTGYDIYSKFIMVNCPFNTNSFFVVLMA